MSSRLGLAAASALLGGLALAACGGSQGELSGTTLQPVTTVPPATSAPATTTAPESLPFTATLTAPSHTPKVGERWNYAVHVTDRAGKPIKAKITVQMVDPLQQAHPVDYDGTTRAIVDWPVDGVFRDYIEFPPDARGFTLTFRATVAAQGGTLTLSYQVTPQ